MLPDDLGFSTSFEVVRFTDGKVTTPDQAVATEVPCTIVGNGVEVGTMLCSPANLEELTAGFLFSSAFIRGIEDIREMHVDTVRWTVTCELAADPDPDLMARRIYTPGCGKGIVYAALSETGLRLPLQSSLRIASHEITALAQWLQRCSPSYRETGGVHTAALCRCGEVPPISYDDIGRHNAVDKAIGRRLMDRKGFEDLILLSSGRTSSEILHKARRAGIAVVVSRSAPTHQSVLRARDMGITLIGFARGNGFTIYSHRERVTFDDP